VEFDLIFGVHTLKTPYYIVNESLLLRNLRILKSVAQRAGCKILLAQKAFSMFSLYPLVGEYLHGTAASGLYEARLGYREMGGETHVFSAAYNEDEFDELLEICDHIVFNSFHEWLKYRDRVKSWSKRKNRDRAKTEDKVKNLDEGDPQDISNFHDSTNDHGESEARKKADAREIKIGIRINPEHSTQRRSIYDPCAAGSRLGVTIANFRPELLDGISGIHFHTLCEQDCEALVETIGVVEEKFGKYIEKMEWVNFGGGHYITSPGYNTDALEECIRKFKKKYDVEVYLEPGEAVALNAGHLVCSVLDIVDNTDKIAILDASAACHMPDVLEMPYRPRVLRVAADASPGGGRESAHAGKESAHAGKESAHAGKESAHAGKESIRAGKESAHARKESNRAGRESIRAGNMYEKAYTYRLAGPTCLACDVMGDYSFDNPLIVGDVLAFCDMAIYTMVKNNTFNGVRLPSIAIVNTEGDIKLVKEFGYEDFRGRLS